MKYRTGSPSDVWARLAEEIVMSRSWRPLLRATVLVLTCTLAAAAVSLVLFLIR